MAHEELLYEKTELAILSNPDSRAAAPENSIRHKIASIIGNAMKQKGLSPTSSYFLELGVSQSHTTRLLDDELGGVLSLYSICRAVVSLDLDISVRMKHKHA